MMKLKRGQVTIFIIIAVVIVAAALIVIFTVPGVRDALNLGGETNPNIIMKNCLEDTLVANIKTISLQGGSMNPAPAFSYKNQSLRYLCYSSEFYKTCVVQEPMLVHSVSKEIESSIEDKANECLREMQEELESSYSSVEMSNGDMQVNLLPGKIEVVFDRSLNLGSGESRQTVDSFKVVLDNNLYELLSIANNIIEWETVYGDAETTAYMDYYRDIKVEKIKQIDGTTVYIISDRNSEDKFQFASRSLAWPPAYGFESVSTTQ